MRGKMGIKFNVKEGNNGRFFAFFEVLCWDKCKK